MTKPNAWRCADCLHLYEAKVTRCDCVDGEQRWLPAYVSDEPPQLKPLTNGQLERMWADEWDGFISFEEARVIVRSTEQAHGIK